MLITPRPGVNLDNLIQICGCWLRVLGDGQPPGRGTAGCSYRVRLEMGERIKDLDETIKTLEAYKDARIGQCA